MLESALLKCWTWESVVRKEQSDSSLLSGILYWKILRGKSQHKKGYELGQILMVRKTNNNKKLFCSL